MATMRPKDLKPLVDWINEFYDGGTTELIGSLNDAVYMLHSLPDGSFEKKTVQDVVFDLKMLSEVLS